MYIYRRNLFFFWQCSYPWPEPVSAAVESGERSRLTSGKHDITSSPCRYLVAQKNLERRTSGTLLVLADEDEMRWQGRAVGDKSH